MVTRKKAVLTACLMVCASVLLAQNLPVWRMPSLKDSETGGMKIVVEGGVTQKFDNGTLILSSENAGGKFVVSRDFKIVPLPDSFSIKLATEALEGTVNLKLENTVSGAFLLISRMSSDQMSWSYSDKGTWNDWKGYIKLDSNPGAFEIKAIKSAGKYTITVNGQVIARDVEIGNFGSFTRMSLEGVFRGRVTIQEASAESLNAQSTTRSISTALLPEGVSPVPTNADASGYQVAFFERGFSDGMTDPERRSELVERMRDLNLTSLRFPGGTWVYWYSGVSPKSVAAFAKLRGIGNYVPYWVDNFHDFRWANDDYFFGICRDLKIKAIYQLNIATWYDEKSDRAVKLAVYDKKLPEGVLPERIVQGNGAGALRKDGTELNEEDYANVDPSFLPAALEHAQKLVAKAKKAGVEVLWEFGNEDYTAFSPKSYVRQCKAFYDAIRSADPEAKFAFCADSDSWTDLDWQKGVLKELAANGMTDLAEASTHIYLTGGGGGPRDTGENTYNATVYAWDQLRFMDHGIRKRLKEAGLTNTQVSMTEYNAVHVIPHFTGLPLEHSMGRSLGEARIWPELVTHYNYINFHDLIRNGYGHGTWFSRIYYLPENPAGKRYVLPLDGKVMSQMHAHSSNQILYSDATVVVSQGANGLLVTVANPEPFAVDYRIKVAGSQGMQWKDWYSMTTPDLSSPDYVDFNIPVKIEGDDLIVKIPAFSFSSVTASTK